MSIGVTICACTFRRPQMLAELLASLALQRVVGFDWSIVIVDNDPDASARAIVERHMALLPVPTVYVHEPRRGISYARNSAVARADRDFVAFIDDDEVADPDWLSNLVRTALDTGCDAVLGPVLPHYPSGSAPWARDCGFFDRPRHQTDALVNPEEGRTGNALVASRWLAESEPFRAEFALTGGEDYDFFRRLGRDGGVIRWADDATVSETVPLDRQRLSWVLERALRGAAGYWRSRRLAGMSMAASVGQGVKGLLAAVVLLPTGVLTWPVAPARAARLLVLAAKGLGRVVALTDMRIETYRKA